MRWGNPSFAAWRRMVAAAKAEDSRIADDPRNLTIFSGFRDPDAWAVSGDTVYFLTPSALWSANSKRPTDPTLLLCDELAIYRSTSRAQIVLSGDLHAP